MLYCDAQAMERLEDRLADLTSQVSESSRVRASLEAELKAAQRKAARSALVLQESQETQEVHEAHESSSWDDDNDAEGVSISSRGGILSSPAGLLPGARPFRSPHRSSEGAIIAAGRVGLLEVTFGGAASRGSCDDSMSEASPRTPKTPKTPLSVLRLREEVCE